MFELQAQHLEILCRLNGFPVAGDGSLVFFGLRGCLPADTADTGFRRSHRALLVEPDHLHPRCTLGQWRPVEGTFALFAGSTVPHRRYVASARGRNGDTANQLLTGYYADYRKGRHKAGRPSGHEAFRQTFERPVQRTVDDLDYDAEDRVEIENAYDNLHAAFCAGTETPEFSSAGCQVVVGFPRCDERGDREAVGPWRAFHQEAYERGGQSAFGYFLLTGREAFRTASGGTQKGMSRVRFGSQGSRAGRVQQQLARLGFYEGRLDDRFDGRSVRALMDFQRQAFGRGGIDGVCGAQTASALGLSWED